MTSIMYKAVNMEENRVTRREEEIYHRLITENKVLNFLILGLNNLQGVLIVGSSLWGHPYVHWLGDYLE